MVKKYNLSFYLECKCVIQLEKRPKKITPLTIINSNKTKSQN